MKGDIKSELRRMRLTMEAVITIQTITAILIAAVIFWIKKYITDNDARHSRNESDIREIKLNYLDRFDNLAEKLNKSESKLIDRLHSTEIKIIEEISKLKK